MFGLIIITLVLITAAVRTLIAEANRRTGRPDPFLSPEGQEQWLRQQPGYIEARAAAKRDALRLRRRQYAARCETCEPHQHWKRLSWHDASPDCPHSMRSHCTCSTCWDAVPVVLT
jgi:hypothetical protein